MARNRVGEVEQWYPLTATQRGMLFHRLMGQRAEADVLQIVRDVPPRTSAGSMRRAWQRLVDLHPVLRTSFRWNDVEEPLQEVRGGVAVPWTESDRTDLDAFLAEDRARGFALDTPPLMRVAYLPRLRKIVWTFHQSILDTASAARLLTQLGAQDAHDGPPFRGYVEWLREQNERPSEKFWREQLRGFTAPTPLPVAQPSGEGHGESELAVASELHAALDATGISRETLILGVWSYLLSRYSGETDVLCGVTRSLRPTAFEGVIGVCLQTVPVRVHVEPESTAAAWLRKVDAQYEQLRAHEHVPLVQIQKWSELTHGEPLFETLLVFDDAVLPADARLHERSAYPLTLTVTPSFDLRFTYDRARIDDATIARVAGHLRTLVEGIAADADRPWSSLGLMTAAERTRMLVEWNATAREYPRERGVHELFEEQARRSPDRVAVQFEDATVTYRELNARANRIARRLQSLGVQPDTPVGILMERSRDMVAALLGILKAGGAYVPLDPLYPAERIDFMLENSQAPVLVTQSSLGKLVSTRAKRLLLDRGWERDLAESDADLGPAARGEHIAYVIYTSGSTGKPKGVQVPHRALANFLETMRAEPGLSADDVLLAVTTLSFDIAGLELWLPLTTGARVELVSREIAADGRRLADHLSRSGATVMQATPATWRMLLEAGWQGDGKLKILCGGEAMPRDLARALLARGGTLWNMYGPTETTIWSTVHRVTADGRGASVPIGKPIANTQVYVLDAQQQPVPAGVAGELYIGGDGVARGYLHRPELTAERFVANPFGEGRLYRTGDAVRFLPDGALEYLHRLDNQVKVRGYRIELGEIEAALRGHPGVADAAVIVRADTPGEKLLVAYVTARAEPAPASALRAHLRETLPEYMVPAFFVTLDALPLTPNGKVDRRALPAPQREHAASAFVAPRNDTEAKLAKIWADVLRIARIGVDDDFFELGGDSFLAVRLFVQIEKAFARKLPLATLLRARTLAALSRALQDDEQAAAASPLVPLQTGGTSPPLFCVHGVGGNVLNYRGLAAHLGPDQPMYALQARGVDGAEEPLTRIEDMAALYIEEIRRVQPRGPYFLAGLSFGGVVAFEMAQQLKAMGEQTALVALFDSEPVGYGSVSRQEAFGDPTDTLTRRLKIHADVLLSSPDRVTYFFKRVRRVWRKVVYRAWQTSFAVFEKLRRPLPRALHDVQQSNYLALRQYKPKMYDGKVTFFYAQREPDGFTREKQHGWSILAASVDSIEVPGDHLSMLDEPHVAELARKLARCVAMRPSRSRGGSGDARRRFEPDGRSVKLIALTLLYAASDFIFV